MDEFIGIIKLFGGTFAPKGWAFCDGRLLPISQYSAVFALLGVQYGGDGVQTFGLPDLRGRMPMGMGSGPGLTPRTEGEKSGAEQVTILNSQMPAHNHLLAVASGNGTTNQPGNAMLATSGYTDGDGNFAPVDIYGTTPGGAANPAAISASGGNQPLPVMPPYLVINYIICLDGIFPSRD